MGRIYLSFLNMQKYSHCSYFQRTCFGALYMQSVKDVIDSSGISLCEPHRQILAVFLNLILPRFFFLCEGWSVSSNY